MRFTSDPIGSDRYKIQILYKSDQRGRNTDTQVMAVPTKQAVIMPDPARPSFMFLPCRKRGWGVGVLDIHAWP